MRIIVVDDHPLVRQGLSAVLSLEQGYELSGEAATVSEALDLIGRIKPDMALIDLKLGREWGLDIVKSARARGYRCKYVVLTSSANPKDFNEAEKAGVDGYILKEALPDELLYAVRIIGRGRKYYDPGLMDMMVNQYEDVMVEKLTPRERDVLMALGQGLKNNEIAKRLFITEYTVKKHISQILDKLNLEDRTQAALYANNKGYMKYQ